MSVQSRVPFPSVGLTGFECGLTDDHRAVQELVHRFAVDVMRPLGRQLDKMTPEAVVAPGSPLYEMVGQAHALNLFEIPEMESPAEAALMDAVVFEEMGFGDVGLAVVLGAGGHAGIMAKRSGNEELIGLTQGRIGCWAATQPSRGSDGLLLYPQERHLSASQGNKGGLTARMEGDEIVINGQTSAWVSNGPIAQVALIEIAADYGEGFFDHEGHPFGIGLIGPLDVPGVSKGKPLHKIGKRALPQGEIFFDNVRYPKRFMLADGAAYETFHALSWARAGCAMGNLAVGLARAALEEALPYVVEREQGGARLASHQLTQYRMGKLAGDVEMARAFARYGTQFSYTAEHPHPYFTARVKAASTDITFNVCNEAMQFFGGNGLTQEYPMEKMLRDARAMLIEDGENHILNMHFGFLMTEMAKQQ